MKKELKDYLHLYLGCEVELKVKESDSGANDRFVLRCVEAPYSDNDEHAPVTIESIDGRLVYFFEYKDIKPILRPLSDMTEEEAIRLLKNISLFDLDEDNNCVFDIIEDEEGFYVNAEVDGKVVDALKMSINSDIVEVMNNDGTFLPVNPQADVFHYLLSKHFDLFGLIEAGLAVNAAELNSISSR